MPNRKTGYEAMLKNVVDTLKKSPEELNHVVEQSGKVVEAANDLTKDELALISAYLKSDLKEFTDSYEESKSGPFYLALSNSIWQGLLDITDRTRLEWMELSSDLEHQGLYQTGDMIALGVLVCERCGHKTQYTHPTEISPCVECGNDHFSRQPLKP
ncbi:zinc ribbon-containing protein [Vibrio sp. AK197]|uniref:Zinc ribbon-containing protein n=1 Tax=Vibrio olivae TaxID=1243002 RepID=A0ABV5HGZ6_9VIBR